MLPANQPVSFSRCAWRISSSITLHIIVVVRAVFFFFTPNGSTRQLAGHPGIYGHRVSSSCECIRVVQVPCLQIVEKKKQCGIIPAHRTNQCNKLWWNEIYIKSEMGSFWSSRSRITGMPLVDWIKIRPFLKQHFKVENFGVEQNMLNSIERSQTTRNKKLMPGHLYLSRRIFSFPFYTTFRQQTAAAQILLFCLDKLQSLGYLYASHRQQ